MTDIGDPIEGLGRALSKRGLRVRVGEVGSIDTSGTHKVFTVSGVRMRGLDLGGAEPAVGDLVFWLAGRPPVLLGKPITSA